MKQFMMTLFLSFFLAACSFIEERDLVRIDIQLHGLNVAGMITEEDVLDTIESLVENADWNSGDEPAPEKQIATLTFFYFSDTDTPEELEKYQVFFDEDSEETFLMREENSPTYGLLEEEDADILSTILMDNTIDKFSNR
ncbi:hypothetical protein [Planococcus lenghuensis]|uniref:Lipoprotein n=1 Tax=Planococcus lenghuensis TaxID=2213202 RepID=A0A1Q2KZE3_9BACL|nr:hypothetical protein [Planococcus lenghuensis]AQQ53570.1 hypothetical protein B0X71_11125 [Planococcus lenghuensis]